jgi:flagellar biosynthetic protein FliP
MDVRRMAWILGFATIGMALLRSPAAGAATPDAGVAGPAVFGPALPPADPLPASVSEPGTVLASSSAAASKGPLLKPLPAPLPPPRISAVGNPTLAPPSVNPLARLSLALVLAGLSMAGLLLHPRTRGLLLERARGLRPAAPPAVALEIHVQRSLGAGQRIVVVEAGGSRLLVGLSAGRMDLLHRWDAERGLNGHSVAALAEAAQAAEPRPDEVPEPADGLFPREPSPDAAALAAAFAGQPGLPAIASGSAPAPGSAPLQLSPQVPTIDADAPPAELPWFLQGASEDERQRIEAAAAAEHDRVAESVLVSLRAARAAAQRRERAPARDLSLAERTGAGTAGGSSRRPPRLVLSILLPLASVLVPLLLGPVPAQALTVAAAASAAAASASAPLLGPELAGPLATSFAGPSPGSAADAALRIEVGGQAAQGASVAVRLLVTLTLLALAPAIVLSMTAFTRLVVVFSLLRQAIGVQQAPPNQVLVGLALFLTWFVMAPTFTQVHEQALRPYLDGQVLESEALSRALPPMQDFMLRNTRETDLALFLDLAQLPRPETRAEVPMRALLPAFVISELKTAFQIGFLLYIPFLVIDIVVSTVLLAMGMMVLPPVVISLPFKLLLFVFVDGWNVLVGSLVRSFA